jgi:hypothetical protein
MKTVMQLISDGLHAGEVSALLVGGHALPAFGYQRQTVDVDCLMATTEAHVLHEVLTGAGYRETERTDMFVRYSHPSAYLLDVDVMLVDRRTFDKLQAKSFVYRVGEAEMRVPCLLHLIALKLHAMKNNPKRELKDLSDIVELLQGNPQSVSREDLAAVCEHYGPAGVLGQIERHL